MRGLAPISKEIRKFGENVAQRAGLKYGEPAPGVRIHLSR